MISSSEPVTVHQVADHYDELDLYYREIWGEHVHHGFWQRGDENSGEAVLNLIKHVAGRAQITTGKRVCDVGCGYGGTARVLTSEFGARVSGITISAAQYQYAISRRGEDRSPEYFLGDWTSNELPTGVFDAVISIESSEHMQDKPAFFGQAHRVLKAGGRMVVCAWLASEKATKARRRHLLEPICREGRLPGMGTETDYRKWFDDAGFALETFEDVSACVRKTWSVCLARLLQGLLRRPDYLRFLFASSSRNRIFLVTVARIRLAYALGAMRYGIFTARKA